MPNYVPANCQLGLKNQKRKTNMIAYYVPKFNDFLLLNTISFFSLCHFKIERKKPKTRTVIEI